MKKDKQAKKDTENGGKRKLLSDVLKIAALSLIIAAGFAFNVVFWGNVLIFTGTVIFSYMNFFKRENDYFKKNQIIFSILFLCAETYFFILGAAGFYSKALEGCHYIAFFGASAAVFTLSFIIQKKKGAAKALYKGFIVSIFLEIIVFNFNAFKLDMKYETDIEVKAAALNNIDAAGMSTENGEEASIEILDIGKKVGTIYLKANSKENKKIRVNIDFADDTRKEYRNGAAFGDIVNDCEKSFFIPINASGKLSKIKIRIKPDEGDVITISGISLNKVIPFNFSIIRILFILGLVFLKYLFCSSRRYQKTFKENEGLCVSTAKYFTVFLLITAFLIVIAQRGELFSNISEDFKSDDGNQITKELVDAFENGQTSLLEEAPEEFLDIENPYDDSQRGGISYLWDHLYYEGNYYSYYGIAPVILLCLPFHLITGYYFPSIWCTFIFGAVGIYFLYKTYMAYMREFFIDMKISLILMGLVMIQCISGVWFCFATGNFYEIAQAAGFAFVTAGSFFMLKSGLIGDKKINLAYLTLSALMLSFGVLSRPTLAVYCICALIFIFAGFMKKRKILLSERTKGIKEYIKYFAAAFLPFILIGGVQMIYNYARFGNIFDFGIQYSLTINDFTNTEFHTHFAGIGFYNYLFAFPSVISSFPFISSHAETFGPNGYYFVATGTAMGLFIMSPVCFSYFYGKRAYKFSENKNKKIYLFMILAVCIIAPFIIIASIWESGYGVRYKADFAWQFFLGAITIAFIIYRRIEDEKVKNILVKAFFISTVLCFILNFAQSYTYILGSSSFNHEVLDKYLYVFEKSFEFWR